MKKHIVLVDDDRDELQIFIEALDMTGIAYKCTWAKDGEQALSQLQYLSPDIVFLDLNMPGLDGFETLRRIMQLPGKTYKVIVYSNSMSREASAKALLLGADHYIQKTETIGELSLTLQTMLAGTCKQTIPV